MSVRIDAHHHFWMYNVQEYDWIGPEMGRLRRDFGPEDLKPELRAAGVAGVVTVQARQNLEETRWLLSLAEQHPFMHGVVGWVSLVSPTVEEELDSLISHPRFRGVRHVLQGEPDDRFMLREDFNRGIAALRRFGLAYDILIYERHLPQTITLVDRHPDQVFVLDHLAKPRVGAGDDALWRRHIGELARRPNVYCKLSGLVTEADWRAWTPGQLKPYIDAVLEAFGPRRLMFGSDWPVCLVAAEYRRWHEVVRGAIAELSPDEQDRVLGGAAIEAYRLEPVIQPKEVDAS